MTEQDITIYHRGWRLESIANVLGFGLSLLAVVAACCICFFTKTVIPIENPAILVLASLFIIVPFKPKTISTLQKIICFYLFGVIINQISAQYFPVSIFSVNINVSYNIVPLLLCGLGYLTTITMQQTVKRENISHAWITALVIITVHIIFLSLILNKFYGYGYERNLSTAGNLMLYLLLFVLIWEKLGNHRFRRSMGLVLALFYLISIFL